MISPIRAIRTSITSQTNKLLSVQTPINKRTGKFLSFYFHTLNRSERLTNLADMARILAFNNNFRPSGVLV